MPQNTSKGDRRREREKRLAAELRANLKKRKAQDRGREKSALSDDDQTGGNLNPPKS